jgi:hypothetical protein
MPALLWGLGFSVLFHAILFSPQLAKLLNVGGERTTTVALAADAKLPKPERDLQGPKPPEAPKPPDAPEAQKPPDAERPPEPESQKPEPSPEDKVAEKPPEEQPPQPPPGTIVKTPEPVPAYPESDEVSIGRDDGDPMSVVIIGRDAFEEHMAQLSQVSQAGFRMSDAGGDGSQGFGRGDGGLGAGGGGSAPNATATTEPNATAGAPTVPESTRTASATPVPDAQQVTQPDGRDDPKPVDTPIDPVEPVGPPVPTQPERPADPAGTTPPTPPTDEIVPPKPPEPTPAPLPERGPTLPAPPNQPPPTNEGGGVASTERPQQGPANQAPGEMGKAGGSGASPVPGTGGEGALSDLESAPTSTVKVDPRLWKNGRLIAARGIQLKPRQPQFTNLQQVSQLPSCRAPVVQLFFDRTGKCVKAIIRRSSGDRDIDFTIETSLYFWRATGKQIDALEGKNTVNVSLELLL